MSGHHANVTGAKLTVQRVLARLLAEAQQELAVQRVLARLHTDTEARHELAAERRPVGRHALVTRPRRSSTA
jgi:hypothetical protein